MNDYNPFSLQGKTILVTGASSGIGRSTAIECSKAGASVIITARNPERLNSTFNELQGENNKAITADIVNDDDLKVLINAIDSPIDGAVLCAGIGENAIIKYCTRKKFESLLATNLFSQTELIRLLLKNKKLKSPSSVVAISSVAANSYEYGNSMYGAGKAALSTWMKYAANEMGQRGIRFNCIRPGMVETPLIRGGAISDEQLEKDLKNYPLGRHGKPEEIAYGAIYLLSDAAAWVTGTDLFIDGGASL